MRRTIGYRLIMRFTGSRTWYNMSVPDIAYGTVMSVLGVEHGPEFEYRTSRIAREGR